MTAPPALATWLYERLGSPVTREAVVGDLIEQYQQGRSGAWYWRQVIKAILLGAVQDLGAHKLLALRALALFFLVMSLFSTMVRLVYNALGIWAWNWTIDHGFDSLRILWFGRPEYPNPPRLLMACASAVLAAWLVARSERSHAPATMFACATATWLLAVTQAFWPWGVPSLFGFWVLGFPGMIWRFGMHPVPIAIFLAGVPLSVVLGGLIALDPASDATPQAQSVSAQRRTKP